MQVCLWKVLNPEYLKNELRMQKLRGSRKVIDNTSVEDSQRYSQNPEAILYLPLLIFSSWRCLKVTRPSYPQSQKFSSYSLTG
ncbi:Acetyl-Coa Carboxylase 2 [Manis pentadactyla]|nr:Acetyl-Coa Carboxylase 2 [Manis pentadactyla]